MKEKIIPQNKRTALETVVPLKSPYVIFLDPSGACNFKCNFCPCNNSEYLKEERHKIMDMPLFKKIIDDIVTFEEQVKIIYLNGFGEPLLNAELIAMIKYIKEKNACREIRLTTNGYLLNPKINKKIVESGIDLIRISIEALNSEDYKKITGINVNVEKLMANIKDLYLKSRGKCKISAKIVNATLKNQEDKNIFLKMFSVVADFYFIEEIEEYWPEYHVDLPDLSADANKLYYDDIEEVSICTAPLVEMTIYSNGKVGICAADWKMRLCYGDANNDSIKDLWYSKKLREFQIKHLTNKRIKIPYCNECKYKPFDKIDEVADLIVNRLKS